MGSPEENALTLRAAAEVFVPGPPHDPTPGAADVHAELFISHYLDFLIPGLAQGLPDLLNELSNQYLLGYAPTNTKHDDGWRKIKVDVDGHHDVRARQGYRATTAK